MASETEGQPVDVDSGSDPGLAGVVPFEFDCRRSGHCCTHGVGHVWLEPGEAERMARHLGEDAGAFRARRVTSAPDPRTGRRRESLRESDEAPAGNGRCTLLVGRNTCSVYPERPEHCRRFPYWESVLGDAQGFERARSVCPGIRPKVPEDVRRAAFAALEALYAELDAVVANSRAVCLARGLCCRFEEAGHELFTTGLEADYAAAKGPPAGPPEAEGRCPYHVAGRCTARGARPVGCRTYFCDRGPSEALEAVHERFLARLRGIERETGYPATYWRFPALLEARGVGRVARTESGAGEP